MKLAVIGGGDLQDSNHLPINERLIELTNKQYPKVLFIQRLVMMMKAI